MTQLLTQNSKIKKSEFKTFNFGIPAFMSHRYNLKTCPAAKECVKGCYARQGAYVWSNVNEAYETRLGHSLTEDFTSMLWREAVEKGAERIRIHDSGDFYSITYLEKWLEIIEALPHIEFYCYTKQIPFFKNKQLPENFKVCYSYGGHFDHLINVENDRHSRVFSTVEELKAAGYADASENDDVCLGKNHRIGLVYHGAKSKDWSKAI